MQTIDGTGAVSVSGATNATNLRLVDGDFDPIAVGAQHQLTREVALEIWAYVGHQLAGYGARDPQLTRACFQEVAARVATRGVWPLPGTRATR